MDYHDVMDIFVSSICSNDEEFFVNGGGGRKLRFDISNKFQSYIKCEEAFF
jgi:hypothetical protein